MAASLFTQFLGKTYDAAIKKYYSIKNDSALEPTYSLKGMFSEEYSFDGKWTSTSMKSTKVTADVVALDSSMPLKKRDSLSKAGGDIPKLGLKYALNENEMNQILTLQALGKDSRVIDLLYRDSIRCVDGINEQLEYLSGQALSNGVISIDDAEKPGTAIRLDFNVDPDNVGGVDLDWSNASANPIEDIKVKILDKARKDGRSIRYIHMGYDKSQEFLNSPKVIEYYGNFLNYVGTNIPTPTLEKINQALQADKRFSIIVHERSVTKETNGVRKVLECWNNDMVVGTADLNVGSLIYADLAEESFKAEQSTYTKAGSFTLVSKYHDVDPIREFTKAEARVVPVIQDIDSIYYLDTSDAPSATDTQTEGDSNITVKTNTVTRAAFITALNNVGVNRAKENSTDAKLLQYYNDLSDENEALVDTELGI